MQILKEGKKKKGTKNTNRKVTKELADEVIERDWACIISWWPIETIHHCFYWANTNRWPDRNTAKECVWLSNKVHHKIHFEGWWKEINKQCIIYLELKYWITNYN